MELNILSINNKAVIPYEVVPLLAGAYVGYNNAQGVDVGTTEQIATYAPTTFATTITPIAMLTARHFGKRHVPSLEESLSNEVVVKETGKNTLKSGVATAVGYGIGYLIGSMNK
ncbi:hypothetical protein K9L97_01755 [Candidatus Woesearchaeota archaeon]|nr:hypothetical protein [Candidatus Woesearchaeota archaeon]